MHYAILTALIASAAAVPFQPPFSLPFHEPGHSSDTSCDVTYVTPDPVQSTASMGSSTEDPVETSTALHKHHRKHRVHHSSASSESSVTSATWTSPLVSPSSVKSSTFTTSTSVSASPSSKLTTKSAPSTTATSAAQSTSTTKPATTAAPTTTAAAGTKFPYPSGSQWETYTNDDGSLGSWLWVYSAPTQMTWTAPSNDPFTSDEFTTTYYFSSTTVEGSQTVTTTYSSTSTVEAACTAASSSYIASALKDHNDARAQHSANPVIWDDQLACIAQRQADSCIFDHLMYVDGGGYGQNLAGGTNEDIDGAIGSWYSEASNFSPYYGQQNPGGDFGSYGHFTQMVWAYTTAIGCGTANCGNSNTQTVCNYYAFGNMGGEYNVMVLPPVSSS